MCEGLREETWPFSLGLLLLSKVNQSTECKAAWIQYRKNISCLPKDPLKSIQRRLCFQTGLCQVNRQTAVGRLVLGKHLWECFSFYVAWLPIILADHHLPLSKIYCYNFLTLIECQQHYRDQILNRLSTFMIKWIKIFCLDFSWVPTSAAESRGDWCSRRKSKGRKLMKSAHPLFTLIYDLHT